MLARSDNSSFCKLSNLIKRHLITTIFKVNTYLLFDVSPGWLSNRLPRSSSRRLVFSRSCSCRGEDDRNPSSSGSRLQIFLFLVPRTLNVITGALVYFKWTVSLLFFLLSFHKYKIQYCIELNELKTLIIQQSINKSAHFVGMSQLCI